MTETRGVATLQRADLPRMADLAKNPTDMAALANQEAPIIARKEAVLPVPILIQDYSSTKPLPSKRSRKYMS